MAQLLLERLVLSQCFFTTALDLAQVRFDKCTRRALDVVGGTILEPVVRGLRVPRRQDRKRGDESVAGMQARREGAPENAPTKRRVDRLSSLTHVVRNAKGLHIVAIGQRRELKLSDVRP